jgi:hypothetical protein
MEKNKTGKYFKYAIGEIILVVIGILIALSINNWNENRKNHIKWINNTEALIKDLKQDTIALNVVINDINNDKRLLKELAKRLSSSVTTDDTLKKIARYELLIEFKTFRPPNNKTFLSMQANGTIELFDEETYNSLLDLHANQEITESVIKTNNAVYVTQLSNLVSKYSTNTISTIKGPLLEKSWQNADPDDLFRRVEALMSIKGLMNKNSGIRYSDLLSLTENVLSRLIAIKEKETG